jgi:transposase
MRHSPVISLSDPDRAHLSKLSRSRATARRVVERAQIILLAADGKQTIDIAAALSLDPRTVARWRHRVHREGVSVIERDRPRSGRTPAISRDVIDAVVRKTTLERPTDSTHWSTRTMAKATGLSATTIRRIWHDHGLKPHRTRSFKISNDPQFVEKLQDIVGLYLHPPEHAMVLSLDEKSQIQALDRTQPGLPMKKGRAATMTHDYKRNGTTTLFAALNTLDGSVTAATCMPRHRHIEWLTFLKILNRVTPKEKELHLIADNYAAHKHPTVRDWLAKHPRFHMHYTPTSASWLNMVERLFRDITQKQIRRGVFHSVKQLETNILNYLENYNKNPKPFIWTKSASDILEKVKRAKAALT